MSYLNATPGQQAAVDYLNRAAAATSAPLRVGGHSKGGNFAVFAAAFCNETTQQRIREVYSNDGPGFRHGILAAEAYQRILDRLILTLPQSSLVGIMMSCGKEVRAIASSASGLQQHEPYTWQVLGADFVEVERRSGTSVFMDETLDQWLDGLSDSQREHFVAAVFDSLEASGVSTISELNANRRVTYNAVLKAATALEPETQKDFFRALKSLAATGTDLLWTEAKKTIPASMAELLNSSEDKPKES